MKSSGNLLENIKHTNIHIIWVPEGEEWQIGAEKLEAIIAKHITNMGKETDIQVQEEQNPEKDEHKEFHTKGLKVKMAKIKDSERLLRTVSEKQLVMYKGTPLRLSDIADQKGMAQHMCDETSHNITTCVMKGKNLQPIILYPARFSFRFGDREAKAERTQHY